MEEKMGIKLALQGHYSLPSRNISNTTVKLMSLWCIGSFPNNTSNLLDLVSIHRNSLATYLINDQRFFLFAHRNHDERSHNP